MQKQWPLPRWWLCQIRLQKIPRWLQAYLRGEDDLNSICAWSEEQSALISVVQKELLKGRFTIDANIFWELASSFINPLVGDAPLWEENHLVVRHPLGTSPWNKSLGPMLKAISLPLDLEDRRLKTVLEILGWKIDQTIEGTQVTLRIRFDASMYPSKLSLAEEKMSALDRTYRLIIAELLAKFAAGEEGKAIADWLEAALQPFTKKAEDLFRLTKELGGEPIREGRAEGVTGTGTGWTIISDNLRELGWNYKVETAQGVGLTIRIQIPEKDRVKI